MRGLNDNRFKLTRPYRIESDR